MKTTMKFAAVAAVVLALMSVTISSFAQSKYDIKTAKKAAKILQKEGWKTDGGTRAIEDLLIQYYQVERDNELSEGRSNVQRYNTKVAESNARRNAAQNYIESFSTQMKGGLSGLDGSLDNKVIDNLTTAMIGKFEGKVDGMLVRDFCLFKTEKDGSLSCIFYGHISKKKMEQAKNEVFQEAIDEVKGVKEFGTEVKTAIDAISF